MEPEAYLTRLDIDAETVETADRETLRRLLRAHVTTVPFETLDITGHPHREDEGEGVSLYPAFCYEKLVERERGGFCYELNGAFGFLLSSLGYDADRVAAMVLDDDGHPAPPANHLVHVVELDRRYLADVGMGHPRPRRPIPLDGEAHTDAVGVAWRVVESDRPDADYLLQYRPPEADWQDRYVFRDTPRPRAYFTATCEYLATAPESSFTGDPVAVIATESGYAKLSPDTLTVVEDGERSETAVPADEWDEVLESVFGIRY